MGKHTTLAQFEFFVLIAVERLGKNASAGAIRRTIESGAGRSCALGSIYAALARLEDKGLLSHETGPPTPRRGGRGRKLFRLTARGLEELRRTEETVLGMLALPVRAAPAE